MRNKLVKDLYMDNLVITNVDDKLNIHDFVQISSHLSTDVELRDEFRKKLNIKDFADVSSHLSIDISSLNILSDLCSEISVKLDKTVFSTISSNCLSTAAELCDAFDLKVDTDDFDAFKTTIPTKEEVSKKLDSNTFNTFKTTDFPTKADKNTNQYDLDSYTLGQYLAVLT